MRSTIIVLSTVAALMASSQLSFADGDGAVKGGVGGAVAGAIVGGPIGAAVGGAAGMAVGGAASGPDRNHAVVVEPQAGPGVVIERRATDVDRPRDGCASETVTKTNGEGDSVSRTKTNC